MTAKIAGAVVGGLCLLAALTAPACACAEIQSKPKPKLEPKLKPKEVRREAPSPLPASVVEHTPPGDVIDAEVRSMSVPVMSILGKRVRGARGEDLGRVVDVLADARGRVRTAIIDFGGFLGVGNHRVAVDWPLLRFNPDESDPSLLLLLSPEKLRTAPEYKENPRPQILTVPTASTHAPAD
jgi:sporulation protein YlmC with PRC-barrel domain